MKYKYIEESEALLLYDTMLNEVYGEVDICGYKYASAHALYELDQIAYRTGFNDWLDGERLTIYKEEADDDDEA